MKINGDKSSFYYSGLDESKLITLENIFSYDNFKIEIGLKYLGFCIKSSRYLIKDWDWLIAKVERRIMN